MNRWFARLAMSFFIIAAVLAWSGYQALQHHAEMWRVVVDLFASAAAGALGVTGTRIKHSEMRAKDYQAYDDKTGSL